MVDSGSDVVTVQEYTLKELDLEPLGVVESRGVHASKQKQLFRARLWIGHVPLDVEASYLYLIVPIWMEICYVHMQILLYVINYLKWILSCCMQ